MRPTRHQYRGDPGNLGMKYYAGSYIVDPSAGAMRLRPYAVLGAGYFSTDPNRAGGEKMMTPPSTPASACAGC